jgi:DNA-binding transcriptional regulator YhcF (GntR family)
MDKEKLFQRAQSMIISSSKDPKNMIISTVKVADLFGVNPAEIDQGLKELVDEGRLLKSKLKEPPYHEAYLLP